MDIRDLDKRAVQASVEVVAQVSAADLARPTPCSAWTLDDLLAHMIAQHKGFAAAAAGRGADPAAWEVRSFGVDSVAAYTAAADAVVAAFDQDGVEQVQFAMPEFGTGVTVPGAQAISFHFVDYVVHGWDVARSIGVAFELEPALTQAALRIAEQVPDGPERLQDGAAFRPGVPIPEGAGELERVLAMLGRSPSWPN